MRQPALEIHREDAAWLAGLLDGEGCFDTVRGNPRVRVKLSDFDLVIRAASLMDATTHETRPDNLNHRPLLTAQITGEQAVRVMRTILPWLSSRRAARVTQIVSDYNRKMVRDG